MYVGQGLVRAFRFRGAFGSRGRGRPPCLTDAVRVGSPSQGAGCDSGNAEGDAVAFAEFKFAVEEELRERAVDVAEAEEAEVVGLNAYPSGAKARLN